MQAYWRDRGHGLAPLCSLQNRAVFPGRCTSPAGQGRRSRRTGTPNPVGSRSAASHSSQTTANIDAIRVPQAGHLVTSVVPQTGQAGSTSTSVSEK